MFRARHDGGPMAGDANDVSIAAPRVPGRLFYAPAPDITPPVTPSGYMLVGYDQPPEVPWSGQVEYVLARERSDLRPHGQYDGMEEGVAVYEIRQPTTEGTKVVT